MDLPHHHQAITSQNHPLHPKKVQNDQHPCKFMRIDDYDDLSKATYVTDILVDGINIASKLPVDMHHGSMGRMNVTEYLDQHSLKVINMHKNIGVYMKHPLKSIYEKAKPYLNIINEK